MRTRGAEALEFALTLPILLVLLSGTIDFGWYWWQQSAVLEAAALAARVGAATPQDHDPAAAARAAALERLEAEGVPFTSTVTSALLTDATGDQVVRVEVEAPYVGLWALVRAPYRLAGSATLRMEEQPLP
jgi:Flp pilus assembly protein TadG